MKQPKLKCENPNNAEIASLDFFADVENGLDVDPDEYRTFFGHGQLWIEHLPCGAQWSVNDLKDLRRSCERAQFCFELITDGDARDCAH